MKLRVRVTYATTECLMHPADGHDLTKRDSAVYVCRDSSDEIVYIGRSQQVGRRLKKHRPKHWWSTVAVVDIMWWCCLSSASRHEVALICKYRPPHQFTPREIGQLAAVSRGREGPWARPKLARVNQGMRDAGALGKGEFLREWLIRNKADRSNLGALCWRVQTISGVWTTTGDALRWYPDLFPPPSRNRAANPEPAP